MSLLLQCCWCALPRVKQKVDSDAEESEPEAAGQTVKRPKKRPTYRYSVQEDTAILRAFARSACHSKTFEQSWTALLAFMRVLLMHSVLDISALLREGFARAMEGDHSS